MPGPRHLPRSGCEGKENGSSKLFDGIDKGEQVFRGRVRAEGAAGTDHQAALSPEQLAQRSGHPADVVGCPAGEQGRVDVAGDGEVALGYGLGALSRLIFPWAASLDQIVLAKALDRVGIADRFKKYPSQLSGGQQQRCAIARALVKNPKLLLCDEPTGALDSKTSRDILVLLEKINEKYGTTMLIVTHNNSIKNMVHKVIIVKDGLVKKEYINETRVPAAELEDL